MDLLDGVESEDLWTQYKKLVSIVEQHVGSASTGSYSSFEAALRRHRQNFLALLKNPPKNPLMREEIKQGASEGVTLSGAGHTILPIQLVDETIIVSDMYDLNEYLSLELLCTAQKQMPRLPGLPRGLVAVVLYYDGKKALVQALKSLVTARRGVSWSTDVSEEIVDYVTAYTDRLVADGLVCQILEALETWDLSKEMELLQRNRALGGAKHRRQVYKLLSEIRELLAGTLVALGAQGGLTRDPIVRLIAHLRICPGEPDFTGALDDVTLALMMAFLYAIDLSVVHRREDGEELAQSLPILKDREFAPAVASELSQSRGAWKCSGLQAVALLGWSLASAALRLSPNSRTAYICTAQDEEEALADAAIEMKVFQYLHETFLLNENVNTEEFYAKRMHTLFTDFIVLMHSKLMDLRLKAEEAARTAQQYAAEGLEPPAALPRHFEALLLGVARLYSGDTLNLRMQYWSTGEHHTPNAYRGSSRGASLVKLVRSAGSLSAARALGSWARACAALAAGPGAAARAHALLHRPTGPEAPPALSWDHIFGSLNKYYRNLRQECGLPGLLNPTMGVRRAVRSDEVGALRAALELVRAVAANDASARQAICDHAGWAAVPVLIGLVSCSIPIPLKADMVLTLGALGTSSETAIYIWNLIESAQLINTVPSTSSYQPCGVETELEEVEARNEEFPLTRALLQLFDTLSTSGIPRTLGAGPRKPGFDPYLTFIINSVFLKFGTRFYRNPEEKWQIATLCLGLFEKFLNQYEPNAADFPSPGHQSELNPPPGFHIMLQMNTKSDFLRLVLSILDESVLHLDSFQPFPGKKYLEASALGCLNLLERALNTQHYFTAELTNSGCSILVTGINKLLLGTNPRSGKPDHMLNVAKFVTYNSWLRKHSLAAVGVLTMVASQPSASQHLMGMLSCDPNIHMEIRHGFVECLEAEEIAVSENQTKSVILETKEGIVNLMQTCLNAASPNISHYLLGFDISKDISKSAFHQPGVMGFPRTCLHSVIDILDAAILQAPESCSGISSLIEGSYRLLYSLCSRQSTTGPILRYLRACNEFIARHVGAVVCPPPAESGALASTAWLLRLCAVELHVTACERQTSYFTTLATKLVDSPDKVEDGGALPRILPSLCRVPQPPLEPHWRMLDGAALTVARKACVGRMGLISVPRLRGLLANELAGNLRPAAPQRARLVKEVEEALSHALSLNQWRLACVAGPRLAEAWCRAAEALCCCARAPKAAPPLLIALLTALSNSQTGPPSEILAERASGTVLILLSSIRHGFIADRRPSILWRSDLEPTFLADQSLVAPQNTLNLKFILQRILNWTIVSGSASQKMRVNLYGALLNFTRIANTKKVECDLDDVENTYVGRLDSTRGINDTDARSDDAGNLKAIVLEAVSECGNSLRECVSSDAAGAGHEVCRIAALACLEELLALQPGDSWPKALQAAGHVRNLIDSMLKDDACLRQVLEIVPKTLKALFVYESKMSLLNKMASSRIGAELLLQQGTLACLANMQVFDCHPDVQSSAKNPSRDFIPSVASRYRQILTPALALCDALITTLGSENHSCLLQITHFLLSHSETVESILRAGGPTVPIGLLIELESLTCVIARSSNQEIFGSIETETALQESIVSIYRIQKLMLALFPRFTLSEGLLREMIEDSKNMEYNNNNTSQENTINRVSIYFKIVGNLVCFARNITANHGVDHGSIGAVFRPVLSSGGLDRQGQWAAASSDNSPHLGVLIQQLVSSVIHFNREKLVLELIVRKFRGVPDMRMSQLEELVPSDMMEGPVNESMIVACEKLSAKAKDKRKEMEYCRFVIDNCLYLVWAHLDFYMLRAVPVNGQAFGMNSTTNKSAVMTASEAGFNSSVQDIAELKHGLVSIFNDTFCLQLVQTAPEKPVAQKAFIEALLRKIKCLLQFVPVD